MKKVLLVVLVMVLSACQKTPETESSVGMSSDAKESVVTPTPVLDSSEVELTKPEEKSEEFLVTLEQARKDAEEIQGKTFEDFELPDKIVITSDNVIKKISVKGHKVENIEISENCLRRLWTPYDSFILQDVKKECTYLNDSGELKGISYLNRDENGSVIRGCSFSIFGFLFGEGVNDTAFEMEKAIDIEWGDEVKDDEGYELEDGFVKISDAIAFVEAKFNEVMPEIETGVSSYKVLHFYVLKNMNYSCYAYKMIVGSCFDGTYQDTCHTYYNTHGTKYELIGCPSASLIMRKSNEIDKIITGSENCTYDYTVIESYDKVISPKQALKNARKNLALGGIDGFTQAGLVYLYKNRNADYYDSSRETEEECLRPFWFFSNGPVSNMVSAEKPDYHNNTVAVDALTGEVYFFDASSALPS